MNIERRAGGSEQLAYIVNLLYKRARVHGARQLILVLFPFLQQALEHDVPCDDAIGDYQPLVGIRGRRL